MGGNRLKRRLVRLFVLGLMLAGLATPASVYGAEGTGPGAAAVETETEIPCEGDTCQPLPVPPEDPQPGTLVTAPGNPSPHYVKPQKPKHQKKKHHRRKRQGGRR